VDYRTSQISTGAVKRGDGFPRDVDIFPHKVSSRKTSSRRRGFTGKGQYGIAGITRKNER